MQISLNLPQFLKAKALLCVTDREHAKFYLAYKGELTERPDLALQPPPEEGKLKSGGWRKKGLKRKGKLVGSPRGFEGVYFAFAKKVSLAMLTLLKARAYRELYLFAPHHYAAELMERLHPYVKAKLKESYGGDFIHEHPLELVRRIRG